MLPSCRRLDGHCHHRSEPRGSTKFRSAKRRARKSRHPAEPANGDSCHIPLRQPVSQLRGEETTCSSGYCTKRSINSSASGTTSPRAAWLFSRVTALGQFRRDAPIDAWCAAGITAVRHEDCGPCTQLAVTMAERAGVSAAVLRALLSDNPDAMPPEVALAWNFTRATLAHDAAADEYRDAIVKRWGRQALVSLAFAITAARIYPTVKYALGHGKACMRVVVGGTPVTLDHGRAPAREDVMVRTA
jgi:hypothetical protein